MQLSKSAERSGTSPTANQAGNEVGSIVEGTVTGLAKFGVFVETADKKIGLVHISEVAGEDVYKRQDI